MSRLSFALATLLFCMPAVADQSACPAAAPSVQASCREITRADLPRGATALLRKLHCDSGDYGSAVDLNGDGAPEYLFCCHEYPHGPCAAVLLGEVGQQWRALIAPYNLLAFAGACTGFVILPPRHAGYHDVCVPDACAAGTGTAAKPCVAQRWQFRGGRYR